MTYPAARAATLAVSALLLTMAACSEAPAPAPVEPTLSDGVVAHTHLGPVEGAVENEVLVFKGVRYGADTATTRFAAPAEPDPWLQPRDATRFGASCPQAQRSGSPGLFASWAPDPAPPYAEDCLFLNVWTPALADDGQRPVMVWLHGGGFATGSGASRAYDGVRLARRGDVVVVTVNHRLNVFGYLPLHHHGAGFEDSAVAGVLDLVLALEWVQANATRFGGDPNRVMIFGESGGGAKVTTLMTLPAAKGLFHRAVVQSGALLRFPDEHLARAGADQVLANLDLDGANVARIRDLPTAAIQAAFRGVATASAPTLDGRNLTRHPSTPDASPVSREVPLLLGTTRTESSLFFGADPAVFDLDWAGVRERLATAYPDVDADAVINGYRQLQPDSSPTDVYLEATTDSRWLAGHVLQAERKVASGGAGTWMYLFDWDTPVDGGRWRSPHALEIGFVFDNVAYSESFSGVGQEQQALADQMADSWIAFARNGDPNNPSVPHWPAYDLHDRAVLVFGNATGVAHDPRSAQRALLDDGEAYGNRYQR